MDRLDAIRMFVRVVECGSFSAVAREAGRRPTRYPSKQITGVGNPPGRAITTPDLAEPEPHRGRARILRIRGSLDRRSGSRGVSSAWGAARSRSSGLVRVYRRARVRTLCISRPGSMISSRAILTSTVELQATDRLVNLVE